MPHSEDLVPNNTPWPETIHTYEPALEESYHQGTLFRQWLEKYRGHLLFCPRPLSSRQIPHSGPIAHPMFFPELLMGTKYLDAGYEALWYYRQVEDEASYSMACELLGGSVAGQFVMPNSEKHGMPPDLLVCDPKSKRFRFVECKRYRETFTKRQTQRFAMIEQYLTQTLTRDLSLLTDPNNPELFPSLSAGQWIHIARVKPQLFRR